MVKKSVINLFIFIFLFFIFQNCKVWKMNLLHGQSVDYAIKNATIDFVNTEKSLLAEDSVFEVVILERDEEIISVLILGQPNSYQVNKNIKPNEYSSIYPTSYIESANSLFLYNLEEVDFNLEVFEMLQKYSRIDSTFYLLDKVPPVGYIDEKKKGVYYFFCVKDFTLYKKIKSNLSYRSISRPKINCK